MRRKKKAKHINATLAMCGSPGRARPDRDVRRLHGALRPTRLLLPVLLVLLLFCQYEFERPVSSTQHSGGVGGGGVGGAGDRCSSCISSTAAASAALPT